MRVGEARTQTQAGYVSQDKRGVQGCGCGTGQQLPMASVAWLVNRCWLLTESSSMWLGWASPSTVIQDHETSYVAVVISQAQKQMLPGLLKAQK